MSPLRSLLSLFLGAGLAAAPHPPQAVAAQGTGPGPLHPVAGVGFVRLVSRLAYEARPEAPVRLEVLLGFPDRARFQRTASDGDGRLRDVEYRFGERVFLLRSGQARSEEAAAAERDSVLLHMELRRATFLWPDGFDWQAPEERLRTAPVRRSATDAASAVLGTLEARLDAEGRPERLRVLDAVGAERDALSIEAWTEAEGRRWPQRLVASFGGQRAWVEELELATSRSRLLDSAFLPPDRRGLGTGARDGRTVQAMDLLPTVQRAVALAPGSGWDEALAAYPRLLAEAAAELGPGGPALDPAPTFELSPEGRPVGCLLRLDSASGPVPAGWTRVPERLGLGLLRLPSPEAVGREELAALVLALPAGATAAAPYLRIVGASGGPGKRSIGLYLAFGIED